jgi:hypothetical protein
MIFMTIATRSTSKMQITEAYPPMKEKSGTISFDGGQSFKSKAQTQDKARLQLGAQVNTLVRSFHILITA